MKKEIQEGKLIDPMQMQQMEVEQMAMSLQPPEPEQEEGMTPEDYERGNI